jgi:small subunit ribosomal protein S11
MSRTLSRRLLAQSPLAVIAESVPSHKLASRCRRPFSNSSWRSAEGDEYDIHPAFPGSVTDSRPSSVSLPSPPPRRSPTSTPKSHGSPSLHPKASTRSSGSAMQQLSQLLDTNHQDRKADEQRKMDFDLEKLSRDGSLVESYKKRHEEPHHLHVYATRHNTHITVTTPDRNPIISKSAGELGFRKSARKHYDSAFQLASYVMGRLQESGKTREISKLEVVLRGFGQGREAVTKALLGSEGRFLRGKIIRVADATRLKFGGTRSKKPRRLG